MSEINDTIKQLILQDRRKEAIASLVEEYNFTEEKASEFYDRYRKANTKIFKPAIAGKLSKGCGCFSILFLAGFIFALYSGISSLGNETVTVDAKITGYGVKEEVDDMDAKIWTYYLPVVSYSFEGKDYTDTLRYSRFEEKPHAVGESIVVYLDPNMPEYASYDEYTFGDVLGDAAVYLVFAVIGFVGYRLLKGFSFKYTLPVSKTDADQSDSDNDAAPSSKPATSHDTTASKNDPDSITSVEKNGNPLIISIIGLVIIAGAIGLGIFTYYNHQHGDILAAGEKVIGEVATERRSRSSTSSSSRTTYHFRIQYQYEGRMYTTEKVTDFDDYDPGDKVELILNPVNPEDVAINTEADIYGGGSYFWSAILLLFGGWLTKSGFKLWKKAGRPPLTS